MPFPFVIWGAAALGAAIAGKKIYDAVTDKDWDYDDDDYESNPTSSTGPSPEEVKAKEREKICDDFQNKFREFWKNEDQLLCLNGTEGLEKYRQLAEQVRNNSIIPAEALMKLKEVEKNKSISSSLRDIKNFILTDISIRKQMIEYLNNYLSYPNGLYNIFGGAIGFGVGGKAGAAIGIQSVHNKITPQIEFVDDFNLLHDEYWVSFLNEALKKDKLSELEDLARDWRRMTPELLKRWQEVRNLENASSEGDEPRVVVCGMLKAGKSTLLNSLFDDPENQRFPTARTRKTKKNQSEVLNGIRFIDTPGLDYDAQDTEEAKAAYMGADLLLFAHDGSKELEEIQLKFLEQLQEMHPDLSRKMFFVITSKEEPGNELNALTAKISEKISQRCGFVPEIYAVENNSYRSSKEKIRATSGIYELREAIGQRGREIIGNLEKLRAQRKTAARDALKKAVNEVSEPVLRERQELNNRHEEIFQSFKRMVENSRIQLEGVGK